MYTVRKVHIICTSQKLNLKNKSKNDMGTLKYKCQWRKHFFIQCIYSLHFESLLVARVHAFIQKIFLEYWLFDAMRNLVEINTELRIIPFLRNIILKVHITKTMTAPGA